MSTIKIQDYADFMIENPDSQIEKCAVVLSHRTGPHQKSITSAWPARSWAHAVARLVEIGTAHHIDQDVTEQHLLDIESNLE